MDRASTINGNCFHFFEAAEDGLKCKECGHLLPLVSTWPVPQTIPVKEGITNTSLDDISLGMLGAPYIRFKRVRKECYKVVRKTDKD